MQKSYKKGIFSWFGYIMPFFERVYHIKKAGFDAISLWWEDEREIKRTEMPEVVREIGLDVDYVHFPYEHCNSIWHVEKNIFCKIIDRYSLWFEECIEKGINLIVLHVEDNPQISPNFAGIDNMRKIVEKAKAYNIKLAVENTRKNEYLDLILENIDDENLGFCHDTSHDGLTGGRNFTTLARWGKRLFCTHISDNYGMEDNHFIPLKGTLDWERYAELFPKNYKGMLTLEICASMEEVKTLKPEDYLKIARENLLKVEEKIISK